MKKKIVQFALIGLVFFSSQEVLAKTKKGSIEENIRNNQKIKNELKSKIVIEQDEKNKEVAKKSEIESEIKNLNGQITYINSKINESKKILIQKENELENIEEEKNKEKQKFKERVRTMYENGNFDYIEILLTSKDVADFTRKSDVILEISKTNEELLKKIEEDEKKIKDTKYEVQKIKLGQENMGKAANEKAFLLENKKKEKVEYIKEIENKINEDKKKYDEAQKAEVELKQQLAKILSKISSKMKPGQKISKGFMWPTYSRHITSGFGNRIHPIFKVKKFHSGIDISANAGSQIHAVKDGTVVYCGWNGGYGNCIVIDHGSGISSLYAHLSTIDVSKNQKISKGFVIGKAGSTGCSIGPHLHFEILVNGSPKDPLEYL